jgi:hypothetical protein
VISAVLYGAVRCYLEGELFAVVIDLYNVRYAAEHSPCNTQNRTSDTVPCVEGGEVNAKRSRDEYYTPSKNHCKTVIKPLITKDHLPVITDVEPSVRVTCTDTRFQ